MKPTDKQMLDWLEGEKWEFYSVDCFQLYHRGLSFARRSAREAISAAMKAEERGG